MAEKENDDEMLEEFSFMETIDDEDALREYVLLPEFWANSWAIGHIESHFNIKKINST